MLKKVHSQSYGFASSHVWMWDLDHKEVWVQKNGCFWTVGCWRRLLRVPWIASSNQSVLKEINSKYSKERLMLKLKLHTLATCCEHLTHWKRPWCWERLRAKDKGATEDETVDGITDSMDTSVSKLRVIVKDREAFHAAVHGVPKSRTQLSSQAQHTQPLTAHYPGILGKGT